MKKLNSHEEAERLIVVGREMTENGVEGVSEENDERDAEAVWRRKGKSGRVDEGERWMRGKTNENNSMQNLRNIES